MGLFDFLKRKPKNDPDLQGLIEDVFNQVFPNGKADVTRHAQKIRAIFNNKMTLQECEIFVKGSKTLIYIASDKTADRIVPSLMHRALGMVNKDEICKAYIYLSDGGVLYSGGDGLCRENPVIINTTTTQMGISAEYNYIRKNFGVQDKDWFLGPKFLLKPIENGIQLEAFSLELANGERVTVYFEITSFFGKN